MRIIYLAHPYGGVPANLERAQRWYTWIYRTQKGVVPVADWIITCMALDDRSDADRALGMRGNKAIIAICDEVWLTGGRISSGMQEEADFAAECGVKIVNLVAMGYEPPPINTPVVIA